MLGKIKAKTQEFKHMLKVAFTGQKPVAFPDLDWISQVRYQMNGILSFQCGIELGGMFTIAVSELTDINGLHNIRAALISQNPRAKLIK